MATNLLLAPPQLTTAAASVTGGDATHPMSPLAPALNFVSGPRSAWGQLAGASTTFSTTYDLGSAASRTVEYLIVARADLPRATGSSFIGLRVSSDNLMYTTAFAVHTGVPSVALYGPRAQDLILCADLGNVTTGSAPHTGSYRYYQVRVTAAAPGVDPSAAWPHSKEYFGSFLDLGVDPVGVRVARPFLRPVSYVADAGGKAFYRTEEPAYRVDLVWEGVTDAKVAEFFSRVALVARRHRGLFLYTRADHTVLDGHRLLHVALAEGSARSEQVAGRNDYNRLYASFEELL